MFADRGDELAFLNSLLRPRGRQSAHLVLLYGRRRVGKSRLLVRWLEQSPAPSIYWTAERDPAELQRRKFYAQLLGVSLSQAPTFESWGELWAAAAPLLRAGPKVIVLDEVPYIIESDPAALSALQHGWDQHLKGLDLTVVLCGSHVRTMEGLMAPSSPLFGRMTAQWHLEPLPFGALSAFFPNWSRRERVEAWSVAGGIPAYLEWLDPALGLKENLRETVVAPGSMFIAEPTFLLYDEVRDPRNYLAVLRAIGAGHHELDAISRSTTIDKRHLSAYLSRLEELRLLERRLPATLTPSAQRKSRRGRYHLADAYFRFYFRFIAPRRLVSPGDRDQLIQTVLDEFDAFVGATGFEDLAHDWLESPGARAMLGFSPAQVGRHWDREAQADLVAPNFDQRRVVIGECKWTSKRVGKSDVKRLLEITGPRVLSNLPDGGEGYIPTFVFFSRTGLTKGAEAELAKRGGLQVDLPMLDEHLRLP